MAAGTNLLASLVIVTGIALQSGCMYNQQSRFQTAFLPAAPSPDTEVPEPPTVAPNLYLSDAPRFIRQSAGPAISRADQEVQTAERHFDRGKRLYESRQIAEARREFDAAVDQMLEASVDQPADRQGFDKRLDEMVEAIHRYDLAGLGGAANVEEAEFEKAPLEDILQLTFPVDPKLKNRVSAQIQATVSQLPLSMNDAVVGYINFFSTTRGRKALVLGLERAGRYKKMISRILDEEGIPQELIHLAQAESGFLPRAISRAAAGGMWQFLKWRGQQYGLAQTSLTDDRFDPEKSTRAAARHLHDLYTHFGDWYLAIAAYNCGPGVVEKAVERTGYADFWELRRLGVLPRETTNYVPIILAMTIMDKNAAEYGLDSVTADAPLQYDTVEATAATSLALVSDATSAPLAELAALNPALLRGIAPEGYPLRVPHGSGSALMAALLTIPPERRNAWRIHTVAPGETLASIGKQYGVSASSVNAANQLEGNAPADGRRLVIPAQYRPAPAKRVVARHRRRTVTRHSAASRKHRPASSRAASSSHSRNVKRAQAAPARKKPAELTRTAADTRHRASSAN